MSGLAQILVGAMLIMTGAMIEAGADFATDALIGKM